MNARLKWSCANLDQQQIKYFNKVGYIQMDCD